MLRRMKRVATGLLLVATAIFIIAHLLEPRFPWLAFVRATAEAAMIGGVADWFAVTALFRHPLGIPIPHTAIVPRHKDRVGRILAGFLQRHFLSAQVVAEKLVQGLSVARACRFMGISRQAHYKRVACESRRREQHASVVDMVRDERRDSAARTRPRSTGHRTAAPR